MSFKWFASCNNIDELKKSYRKLIMEFHPDLKKHDPAICHENMISINAEYEKAFVYITSHYTKEQQNKHNYAKHNINDGYREMIEKIIHFCGSWIWVTGETKIIKDQLHAAGFWYAKKKTDLSAWYWRPAQFKAFKHKKRYTLDEIRDMHGSEKYENQPYEQVS